MAGRWAGKARKREAGRLVHNRLTTTSNAVSCHLDWPRTDDKFGGLAGKSSLLEFQTRLLIVLAMTRFRVCGQLGKVLLSRLFRWTVPFAAEASLSGWRGAVRWRPLCSDRAILVRFIGKVILISTTRKCCNLLSICKLSRYTRSLSRCVQWLARGGKSGSSFSKTKGGFVSDLMLSLSQFINNFKAVAQIVIYKILLYDAVQIKMGICTLI